MKETRLMTPGPVPVLPEVLSALGRPVLHHRTPAYARLFHKVRQKLGQVFQTSGDVLVISGTGTGPGVTAAQKVFSSKA